MITDIAVITRVAPGAGEIKQIFVVDNMFFEGMYQRIIGGNEITEQELVIIDKHIGRCMCYLFPVKEAPNGCSSSNNSNDIGNSNDTHPDVIDDNNNNHSHNINNNNNNNVETFFATPTDMIRRNLVIFCKLIGLDMIISLDGKWRVWKPIDIKTAAQRSWYEKRLMYMMSSQENMKMTKENINTVLHCLQQTRMEHELASFMSAISGLTKDIATATHIRNRTFWESFE